MTSRYAQGDIGGGSFGIRASLPGYNVLTEPFGSAGISFDSRLTDIGTVIATGLITCGGSAVIFPTMPYVPPVIISRFDGSDCHINDVKINGDSQTWIPAIGIVTTSSLTVTAFSTPWYNVFATYSPNGQSYLYAVFSLD